MQSLACSCNYPTEVKNAYEVSHTIVYGEIVELAVVKVTDSMDSDSLKLFLQNDLTKFQTETLNAEFLIRAKLKKKETLKGYIKQDTITMFTTRTGASCGFTKFRIGKEYIIYASPNSYFFSNFYSPQRKRKLELKNTYWVTSCSITSEFEQEHLTKLKNVRVNKNIENISRAGFKILRNEDLLRNRPQINTTILCRICEYANNPIQFDDEEIITDIRISSLDLMLRLISINDKRAEISFKSFDDGGFEHSGSIKLIKKNSKWKKESLNYVTAIE